jgi:uncharacterized protein YdbL (DUF1318 family)
MKRMMSVFLAAAVGVSCLALADSMDDAKERRKARREQVEQLVKAGDASEGADGYLAAKQGLDAGKAELVKAENADRKIGYEAIAKANKKTPEEVGKMAAEALKKSAAKK